MNILLLDSGLGLIPFIKEIIKTNKKNTYYLYMDREYFPYGNKSRFQLKRRLQYLLRKFKRLKIDEIYICCNTLSKIYLDYKFPYPIKIKTILELNLKHLKNKKLLVTPSLKKFFKNDERFISTHLAELIENSNIEKIIEEIKMLDIKESTILGCTHYPLIKDIMKHYSSGDIKSYESELIAKIRQGEEMVFFVRKIEKELIEKYFINIDIKEYTLA